MAGGVLQGVSPTISFRSTGSGETPSVYTEVTSAELTNLISTSALEPFRWYYISDYYTDDFIRQSDNEFFEYEFYQGDVEPIYVQAVSVDSLYEDGISSNGDRIKYVHTRIPFKNEMLVDLNDGDNYGTVTVSVDTATQLELSKSYEGVDEVDMEMYFSDIDKYLNCNIDNYSDYFEFDGDLMVMTNDQLEYEEYTYPYYDYGDTGEQNINVFENNTITLDDWFDETCTINYIYVYSANTELDYYFFKEDYGTTWTITGNVITLISEDVVTEEYNCYIEIELLQTKTATMDFEYMAYMYMSGRTIYKSFTTGLIYCRENKSKNIKIECDWLATKFRRYVIVAPNWNSSTTYNQGELVMYSSALFVALLSSVNIPPSISSVDTWGRIGVPSAYFTGTSSIGFSFNGINVTITPDLATYEDTFIFQSFDLTNILNVEIKNKYTISQVINTPSQALDVVCQTSYLVEVKITTGGLTTIPTSSDTELNIVNYCVMAGYNSGIKSLSISTFLGLGNYSSCNFGSITNTLMNSIGGLNNIGVISGCGFFGYYSGQNLTVINSLTNFISRSNLNSTVVINVNYMSCLRLLNSHLGKIYGLVTQECRALTVMGEIYMLTTSAGLSNTTILGRVGNSESIQEAGFVGYMQDTLVLASFYKYTNSNIGGTTKYNSIGGFSKCIVQGQVRGNNIPTTYFENCTFGDGFYNIDSIATETNYIRKARIGGLAYNIRLSSYMSPLENINISGSWYDCFFGSGTFASPENNTEVKKIEKLTCFGNFSGFNFKKGYFINNVFNGSVGKNGSTYNQLYADYSTKPFQNNVIGDAFNGNIITAKFAGNTVGSDFKGNTLSNAVENMNIGSNISSRTLPAMANGFYPYLNVFGEDELKTSLVFNVKNSGGSNCFSVVNNGMSSSRAGNPDKAYHSFGACDADASSLRILKGTVLPTTTVGGGIEYKDSTLYFSVDDGRKIIQLSNNELTAGRVPFVDENNRLTDSGAFLYDSDNDILTVDYIEAQGSITSNDTTTGQSTITKGLVVNEGGGGEAEDSFRVETGTVTNALYIDAENDTAEFNVNLYLKNYKSGATQTGAGASEGELWVTDGHATLPDGVVMVGL